MKKYKPVFLSLMILAGSVWILLRLYPVIHPLGSIHLPLDVDSVKVKAQKIARELNLPVENQEVDAKLQANTKLIRQIQEKYGVEKGNKLLRDKIPGFYWNIQWRAKGKIQSSTGGDDSEEELAEKKLHKLFGDLHLNLDIRGNLIEYKRSLEDTVTLPRLSAEEAKELTQQFVIQLSPLYHTPLDSNNFRPLVIEKKIANIEKQIARVEKQAARMESLAVLMDKQLEAQVRKHQQISPPSRDHLRIPPVPRLTFRNESRIERPHRTDYQFDWTPQASPSEEQVQMKVTVSGNMISGFQMEYVAPEGKTKETGEIFYVISSIFFFMVAFIIMLILGYRKIRAFEIGFRLAIWLGIFALLSSAIQLYLNNPVEGWQLVLSMVLGSFFIGGGIVLAWGISESIGRETWKEKFITFDLLTRGYLFHSRVGESLLKGMTAGMVGLLIWLCSLGALKMFTPVWINFKNDDLLKIFYAPGPTVSLLNNSIYVNLYLLAFYMIFTVSLLRQYIRKDWIVILIGAILWGATGQNKIQPFPLGFVIDSIVGTFLIWIYFRFDVLTSFVTLFTFTIWTTGMSFFYVGNSALLHSGYLLAGGMGLTVLFSLIAQMTKDRITDFDSITPAFARNITERERLQRELEIARDVQMSFLPKNNPDFKGLDIASNCLPAREVGGDYYDFIRLGSETFGIVIGDVSGKGTQAAFYMTLTKGFLKSLTRVSSSPAEVLTQVNNLFYENVDRGTFISMVYGIFDVRRKILTFARAGHNPIVVRNTEPVKVEMLNSGGIALGLEKGEVFSKTIQEVNISFESGDAFVFYTDGFTEAMNRKNEEFGEERFLNVIEKYSKYPARDIMDGIFSEVKSFIGGAQQHDDMTIVVVKIL